MCKCLFDTLFTMFQPCPAVQKRQLLGSLLGSKFSETGSSCKDPSKNTPLAAQMSSRRPQLGFLGPSTDPIWRQKSFKIESWTYYPTGSNPRRPRDGPKGGPRLQSWLQPASDSTLTVHFLLFFASRLCCELLSISFCHLLYFTP